MVAIGVICADMMLIIHLPPGGICLTVMLQLKYAVFGCGNSLYDENYNKAARTLDGLLKRLGAGSLLPRGEADDSVSRGDLKTAEDDFASWSKVSGGRHTSYHDNQCWVIHVDTV